MGIMKILNHEFKTVWCDIEKKDITRIMVSYQVGNETKTYDKLFDKGARCCMYSLAVWEIRQEIKLYQN